MDSWEKLDSAYAPDGSQLCLWQRGKVFVIEVNEVELMSSHGYASEAYLASLTCQSLDIAAPRVLVGGLGMGFTLRASLDLLPSDAQVVLAELIPSVVEWNRSYLGHLAQQPLRDPRVSLVLGDVAQTMMMAPRFDAIMLDVDNGPSATTQGPNENLYSLEGLQRIKGCLTPAGILAVWSSDPDELFEIRLEKAGFDCETYTCPASKKNGGTEDTIFVGRVSS